MWLVLSDDEMVNLGTATELFVSHENDKYILNVSFDNDKNTTFKFVSDRDKNKVEEFLKILTKILKSNGIGGLFERPMWFSYDGGSLNTGKIGVIAIEDNSVLAYFVKKGMRILKTFETKNDARKYLKNLGDELNGNFFKAGVNYEF